MTVSSTMINRLATESQELTLDWVNTLTEKLRERGVFRPKENEYSAEPSKAPHPRQNMPLPPTPTEEPAGTLNIAPTDMRVNIHFNTALVLRSTGKESGDSKGYE